MSRSYALLRDVEASLFAAGELTHLAERLSGLVQNLQQASTDEQRALLERRAFVMLGQGIAFLKMIESEFEKVNYALHSDGEEEEPLECPRLRPREAK